ncbi:MAG: hypothetical protein INR71_00630 [Terriglobus roseus]|nr:hypothetical protein [Terriglobus roseus]
MNMEPPRFRPSSVVPVSKSTKRTNSGRVKDGVERPGSAASRVSQDSVAPMPQQHQLQIQHQMQQQHLQAPQAHQQLPLHIPGQAPIPADAKAHIEALLKYDIRDVHRWLRLTWQHHNGTWSRACIMPSFCPISARCDCCAAITDNPQAWA